MLYNFGEGRALELESICNTASRRGVAVVTIYGKYGTRTCVERFMDRTAWKNGAVA